MAKIRVLPEVLANKIAAGEIVERPASVVKELVENSIDAHSKSIEVEVSAGGKHLVRIKDDGDGMSRDDAILAFEHHATSKLSTADDLMAINTLGFRGEALPSIASVSRLTLRTTEAASVHSHRAGTEVEIQGGVIRNVKEVAWDRGTEVAVKDLFFNVPARRKFLKTNETELSHVTRSVTQYALAHPEIAFTFLHQGRELLSCPPVDSVKERIYQIFGESFLTDLVEFSGSEGSTHVSGFASEPHEQRAYAYSQFFFVNKRMVRDRVVTHAIAQAYKAILPANVYPVIILFIDIPASEIDVNVHPAKLEIRFRESERVHELIRRSIEAALLKNKPFPKYVSRAEPERRSAYPGSRPPVERPYQADDSIGVAGTTEPFALGRPQTGTECEPSRLNFSFGRAPAAATNARAAMNSHVLSQETSAAPSEPKETSYGAGSVAPGLFRSHNEKPGYEVPGSLSESGIRTIGQLHDSFILAADKEGLLIIDQHVAHERVLYEKALDELNAAQPVAQNLLLPITFDLTPSQQVILDRILPELNRNGFEVETFGGATIVIKAVPVTASKCDVKLLVTEILEALEAEGKALGLKEIREKIAASVACHAAIKINTPLSHEKMQWLADALMGVNVPTHCPHGRPIVLRLGMREIEKNFKRI